MITYGCSTGIEHYKPIMQTSMNKVDEDAVHRHSSAISYESSERNLVVGDVCREVRVLEEDISNLWHNLMRIM